MSLKNRALQHMRALIGRAGYAIHPNTDYFVPDQIALLDGKADPTIFDVGANKGKFAREYRARLHNARMFCLEPIPHLAHKLRDDLPGSEVVEAALSNADGTATFHLNEFEDTSSLLAPDLERMPATYRSVMQPKQRIEVRTARLDSLMEQFVLERIDILKMDIQGGEYAALEGAEKSLAEGRVSIVALEALFETYYAKQPQFGDIAALLARHDYRLHRLYNLVCSGRDGRLQWADAIFIAPSVRAANAAEVETSGPILPS